MMRQTWIDKGDAVALTRQCVLAGVSRATLYARQKPKLLTEDDQRLNRLIDEEYTRHPFYGSRKIVVYLGRCRHSVNRKREQRLMRTMGLAGMAPGPKHQPSAPAAQGVPVPAARSGRAQAQPSLEHGHHLHQAGTRLCLPGGDH